MKFKILFIVLLISLTFLVGCEKNTNEELDVALILPVTGKGAGVSQDFMYGIELAKKELGSDEINFYLEDTQTNPKEAVTALTQLLSTKEIDLIVTMQAQTSQPLLTIADQNNIPIISTLTSLRKEEFTRKSENVFLDYPLPEYEMKPTIEFMQNKGFENIATLTVQDEFGNTMLSLLDEQVELVIEEKYLISELDYRTQLIKIKELNPDAIYVIGYPAHLISFLKQRKELDMQEIPVISTMHIQSGFVRAKSKGIMENVYAVTPISLV